MNLESLDKRISKLESLLLLLFNEAKQVGTLYHIIGIDVFNKYVLPTDELTGSKASNQFKNSLYKNSETSIYFTRDKRFNIKALLGVPDFALQLVIDGDKLSERYKLVPYNDIAFYKDDPDWEDLGDNAVKCRGSEVLALKPIKNISKYISEINLIANQTIMPEFGEYPATTKLVDISDDILTKRLRRKRNLNYADLTYVEKLLDDLSNIEDYADKHSIKLNDTFKKVMTRLLNYSI